MFSMLALLSALALPAQCPPGFNLVPLSDGSPPEMWMADRNGDGFVCRVLRKPVTCNLRAPVCTPPVVVIIDNVLPELEP